MHLHPSGRRHGTSRSLEELENRFRPGIAQETIRKAISLESTVRILEIGTGEGRVLMQLKKLFPDIELYGVNKEPWNEMKGPESLEKTALYYKIFTQEELQGITLPKIEFYDAKELSFEDNYFDIIISQYAIPYIDRKDRFLEEAWRILKKGGSAFLHMDTYDGMYPDFIQDVTPRFIIYKNRKKYPFKRFIRNIAKKGFDIRCRIANSETTITMTKNAENLELSLEFDELSSFDLSCFNAKGRHQTFWGYRSVYKI